MTCICLHVQADTIFEWKKHEILIIISAWLQQYNDDFTVIIQGLANE